MVWYDIVYIELLIYEYDEILYCWKYEEKLIGIIVTQWCMWKFCANENRIKFLLYKGLILLICKSTCDILLVCWFICVLDRIYTNELFVCHLSLWILCVNVSLFDSYVTVAKMQGRKWPVWSNWLRKRCADLQKTKMENKDTVRVWTYAG